MTEEQKAWILSRPPAVQALMTKFPPGCSVRATRPLLHPGPGEVLPLVRYSEHDDGHISVGVLDPTGYQGQPVLADCDPDWLELAEEGVVTRAEVAQLLLEQTQNN